MANQTTLTIDDMALVGGRLCLDFINTTGRRADGVPRERLHSYRDLLTWCRRVKMLSQRRERELAKEANAHSVKASRIFRTSLGIRQTLYDVFIPVAAGDVPPPEQLDRLNELVREAAQKRRIQASQKSIRWEWSFSADDLSCILWPIVQDSAEALTSSDLQYVRKCHECDWLFVDFSKNQSRRFCKKTCSDRVKSRRYYERHKKQHGSA